MAIKIGCRDPDTNSGTWRELRTSEFRYKRPWNGVVWWTASTQKNPMDPKYKGTVSDPYGVYNKPPAAPPDEPDAPPSYPTIPPVPVVIQERGPMIGGLIIGGVVLLAGLYTAKDWIRRKIGSVKGRRRRK